MLVSCAMTAEPGTAPAVEPKWREVCSTPAGYCPQGLAATGDSLFLSAYKGREEKSTVFELCRSGDRFSFEPRFDMPPEATHTSGLAFLPSRPDLLFAVDYKSNTIYLIDVPRSVKSGKARVLTLLRTRLSHASACCVAQLGNGQPVLLVTEFHPFRRTNTVFFEFHLGGDPFHPENQRPWIKPGDVKPFANQGWAQGATFRGGFVYETGNRPFTGGSYLIRYRLEDAMNMGRIPRPGDRANVLEWDGPGRGIEDVEVFDGSSWTTDERTNLLYRANLPTR